MNSKLYFRIDSGTKEAFQGVCEHLGIQASEALRGLTKKMVKDHEDALPEETLLKAKVEIIKEDERPYQQAMHLPNNFFEETRTLLDKRYPPHPEKEIKPRKLDPYKETVSLACDGDLEARKIGQLEHVYRNYRRLHPDTETKDIESSVDAVISYGVSLKIEEDMEAAKTFVKGMIADSVVPEHMRDMMFDTIREKGKKEWQDEWERAMRPYLDNDESGESEA